MSDTATDGASAPVASPLTLKSSDTSAKAKAERAPAPEPKPEPVEAKAPEPKPDAAPSDDRGGSDADDSHAPEAEAPRNKQQQRLPRWMQERLERERQVTRERTRAEVLAEIQRTQPAPPQPQAPTADQYGEPEKTLEDFDFDPGKYARYLAREEVKAMQREALQAQAQRETEAKLETFKARVDTFEARAGAGAWEDIATSPLNTDPAFASLVDSFMGDDHDLDIAHHLAQHMDEARHLLTLSPIARARELTKLADRFGTHAAAPKAPEVEPKTVTKAPPPPSKLVGGKPAVDINSPQISTADRIAAWKKARANP